MAPGQKFNDIQIASDDGRTATWYMNATGTINPVITGLNSGNYLWYLDGVEQGELTADANGTIALSYESTGLHELSVVGQWEDPPVDDPVDDPVDGIPSLVGYGWVIAGLAGCAALAAYIMGYRHPVILAIAAILLIAAALMHYGVL